MPGALLALKNTFNVSALNTTPAKIIANTLIKYGGRLVDSTSFDAYGICVEYSPEHQLLREFEYTYGYSFDVDDNASSLFGQDMQTIFGALWLVSNDTESTPGANDSVVPVPALTLPEL